MGGGSERRRWVVERRPDAERRDQERRWPPPARARRSPSRRRPGVPRQSSPRMSSAVAGATIGPAGTMRRATIFVPIEPGTLQKRASTRTSWPSPMYGQPVPGETLEPGVPVEEDLRQPAREVVQPHGASRRRETLISPRPRLRAPGDPYRAAERCTRGSRRRARRLVPSEAPGSLSGKYPDRDKGWCPARRSPPPGGTPGDAASGDRRRQARRRRRCRCIPAQPPRGPSHRASPGARPGLRSRSTRGRARR